jgi:hypothetical protein
MRHCIVIIVIRKSIIIIVIRDRIIIMRKNIIIATVFMMPGHFAGNPRDMIIPRLGIITMGTGTPI